MGCPSATAPPFGLTFAGSSARSLVTAMACTAKASFDSITSMSAGLSPAFPNTRRPAGTRAEPHHFRRDARVRVGHQPGHRLHSGFLCKRRIHENHRGARIIDAGSVAGCHGAAFPLEHGLELRHVLGLHFLAHMLVGGELLHALAGLELDRNDLALEPALVHGPGRPTMGFDRELVLLLAA